MHAERLDNYKYIRKTKYNFWFATHKERMQTDSLSRSLPQRVIHFNHACIITE